jgi:hypothetical protein
MARPACMVACCLLRSQGMAALPLRPGLVYQWPGCLLRHAHQGPVGQISPDKNVNFRYTTAAFTLSPGTLGIVVLCQLARRLSLVCHFCSSARSFALQLPSDLASRKRPCLRLVLMLAISITNRVHVQGTFTPSVHARAGRMLSGPQRAVEDIMIERSVRKLDLKRHSTVKEDLIYWLSKTPRERIATIEFLRGQYYGSSARLQRSARVIQQTQG